MRTCPTNDRPTHIVPAAVSTLRPVTTERATDAELLDRCRAGDEQAWDELVTRYERLIYSVALRNGVGSDNAADVTQAASRRFSHPSTDCNTKSDSPLG